jgi:hypothetical protein
MCSPTTCLPFAAHPLVIIWQTPPFNSKPGSASHGQPEARSHLSASKSPPAAAFGQHHLLHWMPCARKYGSISMCPPLAAEAQRV